jgi:hypothetical protein
MRRSRVSLLLLVLISALAFCLREVPEHVLLTDDVSNDGVVEEGFQPQVVESSSHRTSSGQKKPSVFGSLVRANSTSGHLCISPILIPSKAGQGLLHLLSEQRK